MPARPRSLLPSHNSSLLCEIDKANVLHVDGGRVKVVDQVGQPLLQRRKRNENESE